MMPMIMGMVMMMPRVGPVLDRRGLTTGGDDR
jgi:hypothetical protein